MNTKCDHLTMRREYYDNCRATCMKCRAVLIVRVSEEVKTKASKLKGNMTKLPKTLRDKRDEDLEQYLSSEFTYDDTMKKVYLRGYDACFSDMSEAVQGLVDELELSKRYLEHHTIHSGDSTIGYCIYCESVKRTNVVLAKYRGFVGSESDEE